MILFLRWRCGRCHLSEMPKAAGTQAANAETTNIIIIVIIKLIIIKFVINSSNTKSLPTSLSLLWDNHKTNKIANKRKICTKKKIYKIINVSSAALRCVALIFFSFTISQVYTAKWVTDVDFQVSILIQFSILWVDIQFFQFSVGKMKLFFRKISLFS